MLSKWRWFFLKRVHGIREIPLILFKLACCASLTGRIEEAKLRISNAIDLDENVRRLALLEEDLRPLWDWIAQTP